MASPAKGNLPPSGIHTFTSTMWPPFLLTLAASCYTSLPLSLSLSSSFLLCSLQYSHSLSEWREGTGKILKRVEFLTKELTNTHRETHTRATSKLASFSACRQARSLGCIGQRRGERESSRRQGEWGWRENVKQIMADMFLSLWV